MPALGCRQLLPVLQPVLGAAPTESTALGAARPGRDSKVLFSKATGGRGRTGKVSSAPSCSSAAELKKQFQLIGGVERDKYLKN